MRALALFAIRRRWLVLVGWIALVIAGQVIAGAVGGSSYKDTLSLPGTETATVASLLNHAGMNDQNGVVGTVVLKNKSNAAFTGPPEQLQPALTRLCSSGDQVALIATPWQSIDCSTGAAVSTGQPALLNRGRGANTALVNITWTGANPDPTLFTNVYNSLDTLNSPSLQVEFTGDAFAAVGQGGGSGSAVFIGFLAALVILSLVFRTPAAIALPLASAIAALVCGLAGITVLSHAMNVSSVTPNLAELMVIGVGVDYALFIVTRHRRNLRQGMSVSDSIVSAINTSGRAVVFAGSTVCIALLGLIALGVSFFNGMAIGTALSVGFTMIASLTLLPAMLSLFGLRVLPRKQRAAVRSGAFVSEGPTGMWARWAQLVRRRRVVLGLSALAVMITLGIPFFALQLGNSDQSSDPKGSTTRIGYDLIGSGFGVGYNSTLEAVVSGPDASDHAYLSRLSGDLARVPGVSPASVATVPLSKSITFVTFKATTSPQSESTYQLVRHLRADVLPPLYQGTPSHLYVSGGTAINVDFATVVSRKMALFIGVVVGLSFILLLIAFRSLLVPLTAAVMNVLAAAGSFGIIVAMFQWGWLSDSMNAGPGAPIDAWIPVLLFAVLFGLSMDYQVFLVSRIREEWAHTRSNRRAVTVGQSETGGIITAAAIIMIAVFLGFLLTPGRPIKIVGTGLAAAVFLDAFILRTVLVPSIMHVFGKANWYFPRWLDKITPRVSVESPQPQDTLVHEKVNR